MRKVDTKNLNKSHHTPVVSASWGLGCWQSLGASGWRSDPEFSCWPTALHGPAGYLQLPPEKIRGCQHTAYYIIRSLNSFQQWLGWGNSFRNSSVAITHWCNARSGTFNFPLTLSIIIWAEGRTLSRASVQLSQGWAKTPSIVSLSSGFTFSNLQGADKEKREYKLLDRRRVNEEVCRGRVRKWEERTYGERQDKWRYWAQ